MIKLSNDIHIHFVLEKEIVKITILKKHTETLFYPEGKFKTLSKIQDNTQPANTKMS